MRHSTLRCACIFAFAVAACFCFQAASCAWALEPLSDDALEETHAATGIRMTVDNLVIDHTGHGVGFIAHENRDSLGIDENPYGSIGFGTLALTGLRVDGEVGLEAKSFAFAAQSYFAKDVWKKKSGSSLGMTQKYEHVSKVHTLDKNPQFNDAGRQVVVLETSGDLGSPFLNVPGIQGSLQAAYGTENDLYALGTLGVSNLQLIDQRTILYAMPDIAGYCSGEGVAMEMGARLSIGGVKIDSASEAGLTFLEMKGVHLREGFADDWGGYDYLGSLIKQSESDIYNLGTADANGFQPGDEAKLFDSALTGSWGTYDPGDAVSFSNMYGGRFMIGNLRQVGFTDYVSGNREIPFHENHAGQIDLLDDGWDSQEYSWAAPIHYVRPEDDVEKAEIVERPMTLSFKTRTDGSQCLVLNMPLHGSIRVEEVFGYNSPAEGADGYLGGNSMGPLIVDGLRVKKLYIEFPGRHETYHLTTAVNESFDTPNPHAYVYTAGELPVAQDIPDGQKDYNPMGRGVEEFLNRMGPNPGPNGTPAPVNSGWAQYRTELNGKAYWQVREPYPINHDFTVYN